MRKTVRQEKDEIVRQLDRLIAPPMRTAEALEVLEEAEADISARIDGLKDDIKNGDAL